MHGLFIPAINANEHAKRKTLNLEWNKCSSISFAFSPFFCSDQRSKDRLPCGLCATQIPRLRHAMCYRPLLATVVSATLFFPRFLPAGTK